MMTETGVPFKSAGPLPGTRSRARLRGRPVSPVRRGGREGVPARARRSVAAQAVEVRRHADRAADDLLAAGVVPARHRATTHETMSWERHAGLPGICRKRAAIFATGSSGPEEPAPVAAHPMLAL